MILSSTSTVWSCTTQTVEGRRSKHVKQRRTAEWWRANISPTPSVPPALRRETPGLRPSGQTTHTKASIHVHVFAIINTNSSLSITKHIRKLCYTNQNQHFLHLIVTLLQTLENEEKHCCIYLCGLKGISLVNISMSQLGEVRCGLFCLRPHPLVIRSI